MKTRKRTKNVKRNEKKVLGIMIIVVIIAAGFLFFMPREKVTRVSLEEISGLITVESRLIELYQPTRNYGVGAFYDFKNDRTYSFEIAEVFKKLPKLPENFWRIKYTVMRGGVINLGSITEEYYKQPEFIADTFVTSGLKFYQHADPRFWVPVGYGSFPAVEYVNTYPGAEFDLYTFVYSSWGVQTYQGLSLVPLYPDAPINVPDVTTVKDSSEAKKYITYNIDPDAFLLEPTYPFFEEKWIKRIIVHVKVSENTSPGDYLIGFDYSPAPLELERQWSTEYLELYQPIGGIRIAQPPFQAVIKIV